MRRCFLVCYDVCDAKRLRRVHRLLKGYGEPWQYSVFFCVLRDVDRAQLQADLTDEIDLAQDRVLIVDLGRDEEAARRASYSLGETLAPLAESNSILVI